MSKFRLAFRVDYMPLSEKLGFKNMNIFLTYESSGYPAAKNLIPTLAFITLYNQ
jgi:hypothetical protein